MTTSPQQASGSTSSGSASPLLEAMAAFSDEVFEATQRLLKAQQQMTRAVLDRAGQDAIAGEEEPAGHQDRDDQLRDEQPGEVDEAGDVEDEEPVDEADEEPVDEADEEPVDEVEEEPVDEVEEEPVDEVEEEPVDEVEEEPVDEADEEPVDEVDKEPVDSQIGRNRVPARAKSRAPAAPKRSTRGRRRSA
jgi:hypothetical protein